MEMWTRFLGAVGALRLCTGNASMGWRDEVGEPRAVRSHAHCSTAW